MNDCLACLCSAACAAIFDLVLHGHVAYRMFCDQHLRASAHAQSGICRILL